MGRYTGIARYAAEGVNKAMDLRLLLGALQFHMLGVVTQTVLTHLEDPALSTAERSRIETAFAPLLAHKEQLLQTAEQRRASRKRMKEEIAEQIAASEERTQLLDTLHAVTMGVPVDQANLEQAALAYAAEKRRAVPRGAGPKRPN